MYRLHPARYAPGDATPVIGITSKKFAKPTVPSKVTDELLAPFNIFNSKPPLPCSLKNLAEIAGVKESIF